MPLFLVVISIETKLHLEDAVGQDCYGCGEMIFLDAFRLWSKQRFLPLQEWKNERIVVCSACADLSGVPMHH